MGSGLRKLCITGAVLSSILCLAAGLWVLINVGFKGGENALWTGIGLYFIGKAFFVGPLLLATVAGSGKTAPADAL